MHAGSAKQYFVFQCDLVCAGGRIRIGNDVFEVLAPAESPRYSGYRELSPVDPFTRMGAEDRRQGSVLGELLESMHTGASSVLSIETATQALALGVASLHEPWALRET